MVFNLAKRDNIPIMFVLAGGYQNLDDLAKLHAETFHIAHRIYYGKNKD